MRTRLLVLVVVGASLLQGLVGSPARAQDVFYEVALGRAAFAFWEDHRSESFSFAFAGQGVVQNSDVGEPLAGNIGCAGVGTATKIAYGCGELSAFSMNDDLGAAAGKGKFSAVTYNFESGKLTRGGNISFDLAWKATGDAMPHGEGGFHFDGSFVGMFTGAELRRDATDGLKGGVTSSPMGRGPSQLMEAATLVGPSLSFELHG